MKASELLKILQRFQYLHPDEDPEVVVRTQNPGVGPSPAVEIRAANLGSDWNKGRFILTPAIDVVAFRTTKDSIADLGRQRLEILKTHHQKLWPHDPYIPKARVSTWVEGFVEGFLAFTLAVTGLDKKPSGD